MSINVLNAEARHDYLSHQVARLKEATAEKDVRLNLQAMIEDVTSLRLGDDDRAALGRYVGKVTALFRAGEIDERTAKMDLNKVLMAAAANNPDVLNYIHMDAEV